MFVSHISPIVRGDLSQFQASFAVHHLKFVRISRDKERGEAAVKTLEEEGLKATLAIVDVEDLASIEALAAKLKAEHGGIDGIVNNAGIAFHGDSEVPLKEQIEKTVTSQFSIQFQLVTGKKIHI